MVTIAVDRGSGWRERTLTIAGEDAPAEWLAVFPAHLKRALEAPEPSGMWVASGSAHDDPLIWVDDDDQEGTG